MIVDSFMKYILSLILFFLVFSCTPSPRYTPDKTKTIVKKSGKKTKTYDRSKKVLKGISSYYGPKFHGKLTANGEVYDMYGLTAAHKTLPLNTIVRVTNLSNDKSLILRINDRGPYVGDRILDCSYGAAKKLDFVQSGTTDVRIEVIEWGDNKYMKRD